jgi:hypothetical protein
MRVADWRCAGVFSPEIEMIDVSFRLNQQRAHVSLTARGGKVSSSPAAAAMPVEERRSCQHRDY